MIYKKGVLQLCPGDGEDEEEKKDNEPLDPPPGRK